MRPENARHYPKKGADGASGSFLDGVHRWTTTFQLGFKQCLFFCSVSTKGVARTIGCGEASKFTCLLFGFKLAPSWYPFAKVHGQAGHEEVHGDTAGPAEIASGSDGFGAGRTVRRSSKGCSACCISMIVPVGTDCSDYRYGCGMPWCSTWGDLGLA